MELTEQETEFFDKGGQTELAEPESETPEAETKDVPDTAESNVVPEEKKKTPTKFDYSPDTNNVTDDLGNKYVPLPAVQEARNDNKALRQQLKEMGEKYELGNKRVEEIFKKIADVGKEPEVPAYEDNPLEHLRKQNEALQTKIQELETGAGEAKKATDQQAQIQRFHNAVTSAEAQFAKQHDDYADAVDHLRTMWATEFEAAGLDSQQIEQAVSNRGAQLAFAAMQREINPAQAVYELSQKVGYKTKKSEGEKQKQSLKTIAEGQEASKSLASGKGDATLSLESIAEWSEEQFDRFIEGGPKNWSSLK